MQFINKQYKITKIEKEDRFGNILVVEDSMRSGLAKKMRIVNLQRETQGFIEYMKRNQYNRGCLQYPYLVDFYFFNKITSIDTKPTVSNKYYYTYENIIGENLFSFIKKCSFETGLDLAAQLCSLVKYLHLRGYLLCNINSDELFVVEEKQKPQLKVVSMPFREDIDISIMFDKDNNYFKAPEVFEFNRFSKSSDIYLIGILMFCILTKQNIEESNFREAWARFNMDKSPYLTYVKGIIMRCTELNPGDRYAAVEDIVEDMNKAFKKKYRSFEKEYVQTLPPDNTDLVAREGQTIQVLQAAKGYLYEDRRTKAVVIRGLKGTGKTLFSTQLVYRLEAEGMSVFTNELYEESSSSFYAIDMMLRELLRVIDNELLERYASEIAYLMPGMAERTGIALSEHGVVLDDRQRIIYRLANFILDASSKHPFVWNIMKFEWIDMDSLEVLQYVFKDEGKGKIFFVISGDEESMEAGTSTAKVYQSLADIQQSEIIELGNFNISETAEFIRLLLGMNETPLDFAANVYKETEGNPSSIYEYIYLLYTNSYIFVNQKGEWVFDHVDFGNINLSFSIDDIILNKVNRLSPIQKEIIQSISIFNTAPSSDVLEKMVNLEPQVLYEMLAALSAINILSRKVDDWGITFDFNTLNLKKAIYKRIPKEDKRKYHDKVSYILEQKFEKENRENRDELIYHMIKADRCHEAIELLIASAEKMLVSNLTNQAIQFLEQTYELTNRQQEKDRHIFVCHKLGELYVQIGEYDKGMFFYDAAENGAKQIQAHKLLADICINKMTLLYRIGNKKEAVHYAMQAKRLITAYGYAEGLYELIINLDILMFHKRKYSSFIHILSAVKDQIDKSVHATYYARILIIYSRFLQQKNRYAEALRLLEESVAILEQQGQYKYLPLALNNIGITYALFINDIPKAREYYEKSLSISEKTNNLHMIEKCYNNIADMYRLEDRYKEALEYFNKGLEIQKISKTYDLKVLLNLNIAMVNTAFEDYKESLQHITTAEALLEENKTLGDYMEYAFQCKSELYYKMGYFNLAASYAQKSIDMCVSWGIAVNQESILTKRLSDIWYKKELDYFSHLEFCHAIFLSNFFKLGRTACFEFAQAYYENGSLKQAQAFYELGCSYRDKIETDLIALEYQYIEACLSPKAERLIRFLNLMAPSEAVENNDIKWKIYKQIALELHGQNNYQEAIKYLITALSYLRKLVYNVPDEHKVTFVTTHNRNSIKENLIKISAQIMSLKNGKPIGVNIDMLNSTTDSKVSLQNIDRYFDYASFRNIYRYKELEEKGGSLNTQESISDFNGNIGDKFIYKIRELITKFSDDNVKNLQDMVALFAEITQAKNAFIFTMEENDTLNLLSAYNRYTEMPFYKYIVEQVKQKRDSIIVTDAFEYNRKKGDILIPKDITAVFCLPIMANPLGKNELINNAENVLDSFAAMDAMGIEERRRYKLEDGEQIIGYIYLDTDSIINNFTQESSAFCLEATKIAYILVDNYNLKIISSVDKLTKLYTRKYFEAALQSEMNYAENAGISIVNTTGAPLAAAAGNAAGNKQYEQFAIIMIDIDKFKTVNDRFGHQKGDEVLQSVSSIIMNTVRKGDICGRYGGEEIIILLPATDGKSGLMVAEKIRKRIENAKLLGLHTPLTISLGVASYPEHSIWTKDLIEKADQALYHAKESGRNQSVMFHANMSKTVKRIDKLAGIISGNLVDDQRKVETMLEILELQRNTEMSEKEKLFSFLGRIIEVSEAQTGILFDLERNGELGKRLIRKKFIDTEVEEAYYNEILITRCVENQAGEYLVDWSNYPGMDAVTGMPDWQSNIVMPLINLGKVKGVLYLSVSAKYKEFDANQYNFIKTLCDIISPIM